MLRNIVRVLSAVTLGLAVTASAAQADDTLTQTECSYGLSGVQGDNDRQQAGAAIISATGWTQVGGSALDSFWRISGYPDRGRERWVYTYQAPNGTRWTAMVQFACRDFNHDNKIVGCDDWLNWANGPYFAGSSNWIRVYMPDPAGCIAPDPYPWDRGNT